MIEASEPVPEHLRRLLRPVQSLGGARPKASFRDERGFLWVAKFPSQEDVFNMDGAEAACLDMAVACGIAVTEREGLSIGGAAVLRSEERRVGKACVCKCRSRGTPS